MLEVVLAATVFLTVTLAAGALLTDHLRLTSTSRGRVIGANLAEGELEALRNSDLTNPPLGRTTSNETVGGVLYTLTKDVNWITMSATAGACEGGAVGAVPVYLRADVSVTWAGMTSPAVSSSTLVRPQRRSTAPGTVAVTVKDRTGRVAAGHTVLLALPDGTRRSVVSDGSGCALFSFLSLGSYTASLFTPGYADPSGNTRPSQGLTLTAARPGPASWPVTYDTVMP